MRLDVRDDVAEHCSITPQQSTYQKETIAQHKALITTYDLLKQDKVIITGQIHTHTHTHTH